MNKALPKPKKTLKTFILENDAKIVDKTSAKIVITTSFITINMIANSSDANAQGHKNSTTHGNNLNTIHDFGETQYHVGNNFHELGDTDVTDNDGSEINTITEIPPKTLQTVHANHYNHKDGGGQGCSNGFQKGDDPKTPSSDGSIGIMPEEELKILKESNNDA